MRTTTELKEAVLQIRIKKDKRELFNKICKEKGTSASEEIRKLINKTIEDNEGK